MKQILLVILTLITLNIYAQKLEIITLEKLQIVTTLLDSTTKVNTLTQFNGKQDNSIRQKWTARTYKLSNRKILIEFYDKQAILIDNLEQFRQLGKVRFVKNSIDFLKKNISYKIELTFDEGTQIIKKEAPKRLKQYKSDLPELDDFEVYQLNTGQILFLDKSKHFKTAAIYPDIKTLASEQTAVLEKEYGFDDEHLMKILASGDKLIDYDVNAHSIYPKYLKKLIKNHKLSLVEQKVYVAIFFGNLYKSENGYYVLIDEVNQENGAGNKMQILDLRIYDNLKQVREAEKEYAKFKEKGMMSEYLYQKMSDKYGQKFSDFVPQLIEHLPTLLNFDKEQLSFDSLGMDLVDEAIKWNGANCELFDNWFPSVLAYYGQCYILKHNDGIWTTTFNKEGKVWIPELRLNDGTAAWDWGRFYKSLYESPIPMRWIGDWDRKYRN